MESSYTTFFSLGYRCSSAGILKRLGLKQASYPFDWLVSRLPVIEHCMKTEFEHFLNPEVYATNALATFHYRSDGSEVKICDENVVYNTYYTTTASTTDSVLFETECIFGKDAYAYPLMMNHHNIFTSQDHAYYVRCVERWRQLMSSPDRKLALYIHPCLNEATFVPKQSRLWEETRQFHERSFTEHNIDGIYVFPVRTETPEAHQYMLEEQFPSAAESCKICILWVSPEFIDAGEIFMGASEAETWVLQDYVLQSIRSGN